MKPIAGGNACHARHVGIAVSGHLDVSHADGTRLVIEYVEKFWCPTVTGADLLAAVRRAKE